VPWASLLAKLLNLLSFYEGWAASAYPICSSLRPLCPITGISVGLQIEEIPDRREGEGTGLRFLIMKKSVVRGA